MVIVCCVKPCKNKHSKLSSITFHRFPLDEIISKKWAEQLCLNRAVPKSARVCSAHFRREDFFENKLGKTRIYLKKNVIPIAVEDCSINPAIQPSTATAETSTKTSFSTPSIASTNQVRKEGLVNEE